jgi:peptidoglycan hydrolase-like protein with peptidoglycan-binding domain
MAAFSMNDTIALMMRVLSHHREIIDWWHKTSALLQKLGLLGAQVPAAAHSTHKFDVFWLQSSLNTLIKAGLDVDGVMGVRTVAAVTNFQRENGLDPDGWVGVLTLAKIEELMEKRG